MHSKPFDNINLTNDIKEFPGFSEINKEMSDQMLEKLNYLLAGFSSKSGIQEGEIRYSNDILVKIFERIEKRRIYFHVFYRGCKLGELNEGALLCFWIAKLQPFHHPMKDSCILNASIASYVFAKTIELHQELQKRAGKQEVRKVSDRFIRKLGYSLVYRDISKESLMLLAESFLEEDPDEADTDQFLYLDTDLGE